MFFLHICCQFKTLRFKKVKDLTPTILFVVEVSPAKLKYAKQSMKEAVVEFKLYGVSDEKKISF